MPNPHIHTLFLSFPPTTPLTITNNTSGGGEETTKDEDEKMKEPEPLTFLATPVAEEDLSPKVATTYHKLAWTITNQFRGKLKTCVDFVQAENEETCDAVVEGL